MTADPQALSAQRLRDDFDSAFAELPQPPETGVEALLSLSLGGDPYALRVAEIRGLARDRPVAPMPGATAAFLGLAGLRGTLLPVWDLAQILGYGGSSQARWLALSAAEPALALAFEHFEGYLHIPKASLRPAASEGPFAMFSTEHAVTQGRLRPVLDLALLLKAVQIRNPSTLKRNAP